MAENKKKVLTKDEKHKMLTELVSELFNVVGPSDVLFKEKEGNWYLGERKLAEAQLRQYAEEAKIIRSTILWKELDKCLKYITNRKMFLQSKDIDDLIGGKLVLFVLKTQNDILDTAERLLTKR